MNKLTLPKWWEALLLLLPIGGTIVSMIILLLLPIGVVIAMIKGNSLRVVRNWPLIQGMLLISPVLSTISLIGSSYIISLPPIGSIIGLIGVEWVLAYVIVGICYNKAVVEVGEMVLYVKSTKPNV